METIARSKLVRVTETIKPAVTHNVKIRNRIPTQDDTFIEGGEEGIFFVAQFFKTTIISFVFANSVFINEQFFQMIMTVIMV